MFIHIIRMSSVVKNKLNVKREIEKKCNYTPSVLKYIQKVYISTKFFDLLIIEIYSVLLQDVVISINFLSVVFLSFLIIIFFN